MTDTDEHPPLHRVHAERIPYESWALAGIEALPPGWVNVRIWSYDQTLGRDLYVTEVCPGILHFESTVTQHVMQYADPDGNLYSEWGEPYDDKPTITGTLIADPPHRHHQHADPTWRPAYMAGGYLGTTTIDRVAELLTEHGYPDAVPRPDGWTHPDTEDAL